MLKPLHQAIAKMELQIERAMDQHPDAAIFRSFPGAGPQLAPRLLAAFGTDRERFKSAVEVAQFFGIAPVIQQSGNTKTVHVRHHCPKFGRQSFHENAGCALREELWASSFHRAYKLKHNNRHHQANRSLAFKLIRVYFACWKNHQPFDPDRYNRALEATGSPYRPSAGQKPTEKGSAKKCS
jgi:transposase